MVASRSALWPPHCRCGMCNVLQRRSPIHPMQVFTTLHLVYRVYNELSTVQSLLIAACSLYQSLARTCGVCQLRKL